MDLRKRLSEDAEELHREFEVFLEILGEKFPETLKSPHLVAPIADVRMFLQFFHRLLVIADDDPRMVAMRNFIETINRVRKRDDSGGLSDTFDLSQLICQQPSVNEFALALVLAIERGEKVET